MGLIAYERVADSLCKRRLILNKSRTNESRLKKSVNYCFVLFLLYLDILGRNDHIIHSSICMFGYYFLIPYSCMHSKRGIDLVLNKSRNNRYILVMLIHL